MKGFAFIVFLMVFIPGCEKEDSDYRDKFTGRYDFEIENDYNILHYISPGEIYFTNFDTVFSFTGKVSKSQNFDNKILIDWGRDTILRINDTSYTQKTEFEIDSGGNLKQLDPGIYSGGYIHRDTISFYISSSGGMGGLLFSEWTVKGLKK
jgi:hypothetical protein